MSKNIGRRAFTSALGVVAVTRIGAAVPPARMLRLAWVSTDQRNSPSPNLGAFRAGMRDLGWIERRNLAIESWSGEGTSERIAQQVGDIVRSQPAVTVAAGGLALFALLQARVTAPIVFSISAEPVEAGIIESFARPGGNITGISLFALALVGKRMQLLKEALPAIRQVAVIANPQHPGEPKERDAAQSAASALQLTCATFQCRASGAGERPRRDPARP